MVFGTLQQHLVPNTLLLTLFCIVDENNVVTPGEWKHSNTSVFTDLKKLWQQINAQWRHWSRNWQKY